MGRRCKFDTLGCKPVLRSTTSVILKVHTMKLQIRSTLGLIGLTAAAGAFAQSTASGGGSGSGESLVASVSECRKISSRDERLACFDRTTAALDAARTGQGLVIMDRAEIREKRRSLFGFQLPKINLFGSKDDEPEEEFQELTSTIRSVSRSGRDNFTLRLADNSVWRTTEPSKFDPERGDEIRIKRAALGTYRANVAKGRAVRIQRVE